MSSYALNYNYYELLPDIFRCSGSDLAPFDPLQILTLERFFYKGDILLLLYIAPSPHLSGAPSRASYILPLSRLLAKNSDRIFSPALFKCPLILTMCKFY